MDRLTAAELRDLAPAREPVGDDVVVSGTSARAGSRLCSATATETS
ncbi:MAG TPA: hypothetical protein VFI18_03025 [Gaiellales bacterium]|nr:hypothetical protein [Gaiellales bacterium]